MSDRRHVVIHTDGACIGNPGRGGYAAILQYGPHRKELSGGFRKTTNNRMEMLAAMTALSALKEPCRVTLYSDSEYVVRAMREGWPHRWKANGWMKTRNDRAANADLWESLLRACEPHDVEWQWVRGHAGNADNERCDRLAMKAAHGTALQIDEGFEANGEMTALTRRPYVQRLPNES